MTGILITEAAGMFRLGLIALIAPVLRSLTSSAIIPGACITKSVS
jgi:hypothetical protein